MKLRINVDCTPEEARRFLGLPEVAPLQEALLRDVEARLRASLQSMDAETMMKTWLPLGLEGFERLQSAFWKQMAEAAAGASKQEDKE
jgi:hypothetical protein